jgi:hypothetical protein
MRIFLFLLCVALAPKIDLISEIAAAFRAGDAKSVSSRLGLHVDLTVSGKQEMYSKAQAEQVLRDFFAKHPPQMFNLKSKSTDNASKPYGIGSYVDTSGQKYRVYFLIKRIGNQSFISQLSIEHEH